MYKIIISIAKITPSQIGMMVLAAVMAVLLLLVTGNELLLLAYKVYEFYIEVTSSN